MNKVDTGTGTQRLIPKSPAVDYERQAEENRSGSVSFAVGDSFQSFEEVEDSIRRYKEVHFVEFWKKDTRTIQAASKRLNRPLLPRLKYYEVKYCCIHGGQRF